MKTDELKKMTTPELQKELMDLLKEQFNMRIQRGSGQTVRSHLVKSVRRNIARVKTILREQELAGNKE